MSKKIFGVPNLTGAVAIGIDQSYTGFGITALDKKDHFYTEVYKSEETGVKRLYDIRNYVEEFLMTFNVERIAMEGYAFGSQTANMAGELGGILKLLMYDLYPANDLARYPLIVPPTSLKKYITGKGQGINKNQILLAVYKHYEVEFTDDNAADSYILAKMARGEIKYAYQKEVLEKLYAPNTKRKNV